MDRWREGGRYGKMGECRDRGLNGWMDRWMDGRADGWMEGWMNEWMDEGIGG